MTCSLCLASCRTQKSMLQQLSGSEACPTPTSIAAAALSVAASEMSSTSSLLESTSERYERSSSSGLRIASETLATSGEESAAAEAIVSGRNLAFA